MTVDTEEKMDIVDVTMVKDREPGTTYVDLKYLDFDISSLNTPETRQKLTDIGNDYINKYGKKGEKDELGLVVGRFQPPHLGHLFQVLAALEVADHVVIGLGSANQDINTWNKKADQGNPLPAEEREFLFTHFLEKIGRQRGENLLDRVSFLPINDVGQDEKWRNLVIDQVETLGRGPIDVVVANDGWVKRIFNEFGTHTHSVPFFEREKGKRYEGNVIRKFLRRKKIFAPRGKHRVIQAHL